MTKPPTDLLVWYAIHYLSKRTDRGRVYFPDLRNYLVPNLLTNEELTEILDRGEDFGVIRRSYHMRADEPTKVTYHLEVNTTLPPMGMDMFGHTILSVLAYKEREK